MSTQLTATHLVAPVYSETISEPSVSTGHALFMVLLFISIIVLAFYAIMLRGEIKGLKAKISKTDM